MTRRKQPMAKLTKTLVFAMFMALCLCGMSFAGGLPDTGQTKCYTKSLLKVCSNFLSNRGHRA